jgi:signal transduction histidine kinase
LNSAPEQHLALLHLCSLNDRLVRLLAPARRNVEFLPRRLHAFGIVAVIGFPLYYYIWHDLFPQAYENLPLRLVGMALFVPMLCSQYWPDGARRHLSLYWYFSLLYALPFFFTFMLLKNNGSGVWVQSTLAAVFVMILLLDWVMLVAQFVLGAGLAAAAYFATTDPPFAAFTDAGYFSIVLFAVVIGAVSSYYRERIRVEQERTMLATAGSIAHELRTPLLSIRSGAAGLANHLPTLIAGYHLARQHELPVPAIRLAHLDAMKGVLERIEAEASHSNAMIDLLLVNARLSGAAGQLVDCSIAHCIDTALRRYPFTDSEHALVSWNRQGDFSFVGSELMTVHVLFNLIQNALRHISESGKGNILIRIETSSGAGRLIFRDTGSGIAREALPHIFTRFYSTSADNDLVLGAGIGLAFCRDAMHAFGGRIECQSERHKFTEFVLTFPRT